MAKNISFNNSYTYNDPNNEEALREAEQKFNQWFDDNLRGKPKARMDKASWISDRQIKNVRWRGGKRFVDQYAK